MHGSIRSIGSSPTMAVAIDSIWAIDNGQVFVGAAIPFFN
jgi:hypothetical protein